MSGKNGSDGVLQCFRQTSAMEEAVHAEARE